MKGKIVKNGLYVRKLSDGSYIVEDFIGRHKSKMTRNRKKYIDCRVSPKGVVMEKVSNTEHKLIVEAIREFKNSK